MALQRLNIVNIRNISRQELIFSNDINVLYGSNGSGKTSVLEAIYMLSTGKSFRAQRMAAAVQHGAEGAVIEAWMQNTSIKLQKKGAKKAQFFVANQVTNSIVELARLLPVQLLSLQGYQLLNAPPEERRKFFDWTMFHVEPGFLKLWQDFHRTLKQRNAVLRDKYSQNDGALNFWTEKLVETGCDLHETRLRVLKDWLEYTKNYCQDMPGVKNLSLDYLPGWNAEEVDYAERLALSLRQDSALGYTRFGPHRADLQISVAGEPAQQMLSTGQQKTFVAALQLAQSQWVADCTDKHPVLLIDDLPSELDKQARAKLSETLSKTPSQIFITSVEKKAFSTLLKTRPQKMFHVEHGLVTASAASNVASPKSVSKQAVNPLETA